MINSMGAPQSVLILGGTSEIALATLRRLPRSRIRRVVLAGRPSERLDAAVADLTAAGFAGVEQVAFEATDTDTHGPIIDAVFDAGDVDLVLLAFGVLGDQAESEADPRLAVTVATINYTAMLSTGLNAARRLREQGHGSLVVLSSVAGDRARRANFVYGSTKSGLDAFAQGLSDALHGTGVHVLVVRAGFVRGRMTEGRPEAPMAVTPDEVAAVIVSSLRKGRGTVYVPAQLRVVMTGVKLLPRSVFRKLPY
ncbi:MAG: decaprenylphospho-beta-D-erythro-pentofuranosid-2-ulose 2-reductase [Actinomycetota bacterium]|nr:decaprenylphospho-beta-D-erythro-pentofuranosid-2-ulose 2-reductase [Actinomycetota bacterium]